MHNLIGHKVEVLSVVFSPDGKFVASGGNDNNIRLWDVASGEQLQEFTGHTDRPEVIVMPRMLHWLKIGRLFYRKVLKYTLEKSFGSERFNCHIFADSYRYYPINITTLLL